MNIHELKNGNMVYINQAVPFHITKVYTDGNIFDGYTDFEPDDMYLQGDHNKKQHVLKSELNYIPLTEEILTKSNFELHDRPETIVMDGKEETFRFSYIYTINDVFFVVYKTTEKTVDFICYDIRYGKFTLKYVHELQNLFHAVNKEITLEIIL